MKYMKEMSICKLLSVLLQLLKQDHWEVRHGGLLGIKYLLIVRKVCNLQRNLVIFRSNVISSGFPPIREVREFRENFEDFFQSGKSGKNRGFFSQNQGKKFQIRELFFQTIFKPFKPINLRKMFFKTVKPQELSGNCNICIDQCH